MATGGIASSPSIRQVNITRWLNLSEIRSGFAY
jgi:hypothetical protein